MIGKKWNLPTVFAHVHLFAESLPENFTLPIHNVKVEVFTETLNHERPETHEVCWKGKQTGPWGHEIFDTPSWGGISNVANRWLAKKDYQVLPSDLFRCFKWSFQGISDLHFGRSKGHLEEAGRWWFQSSYFYTCLPRLHGELPWLVPPLAPTSPVAHVGTGEPMAGSLQ